MTTKHLTSDEVYGYIYHTLDDAQREIMDAHLLDCQICRAKLSEGELRQRQISNGLQAALKSVSPSAQMRFADLAPHLQSPRGRLGIWPRLSAAAPASFALVGLFLAAFGLWQVIGMQVRQEKQTGAEQEAEDQIRQSSRRFSGKDFVLSA